MKIRWLSRTDDYSGMGLDKEIFNQIALKKNSRPDEEGLRLLFNSRIMVAEFLRQLSTFNLKLNTFKIQIGICDSHDAVNMRPENILISDTPLVYFGDIQQMQGFLKMFGERAAVISKKSKSKYRTIAYQRHLSDKIHLGSVSLGEFKSDFTRAESTLRNADAIFLETNAIRRQESFDPQSEITGLDIYEACQLLRYCGLSTDHFFLFINTGETENPGQATWECLALLFWYYMEGKNQSSIDHVEHEENHVYLVENSYFREPVSFIKGYQTKRWWFVHPETGDKIACSEQDYQALREGLLPDILVSLSL